MPRCLNPTFPMYHSVLSLHSSVYIILVILLSDRSVQYHSSVSSSLILFINSPSYIVPQCGTVLFHHPYFVVYPSIHPPFLVLHNPSLSSLIQRATVSSSSVYSMNLSTHPPYLCHSPLLSVSSCSSCFLLCSYIESLFIHLHPSLSPSLRHPSYHCYLFYFLSLSPYYVAFTPH